MATVSIRRAGSGIVYEPNPLQLSSTDFVVFANYDEVDAHQPTKLGEAANYWFDDVLPPFQADQPAATSPAINFEQADGNIDYEDGLHPGGVIGKITF